MFAKNDAHQQWLESFIAELGAVAGSVHERRGEDLHLTAAHHLPPPVVAAVAFVPRGKGMAGLAQVRRAPVQTCHLQTDDTGNIKPAAQSRQCPARHRRAGPGRLRRRSPRSSARHGWRRATLAPKKSSPSCAAPVRYPFKYSQKDKSSEPFRLSPNQLPGYDFNSTPEPPTTTTTPRALRCPRATAPTLVRPSA